MKLIYSVLLSICLLSACGNKSVDVKSEFISKVVIVRSTVGLGTGTIINTSPYLIVTNHHVVENNLDVQINFPYGTKTYIGKIIKLDEFNDLALIYVENSDDVEATSVPVCSFSPIIWENVIAVGAGGGLYPIATIGKILNPLTNLPIIGSNSLFIQHNALIAPGNSGGPLIKYESNSYCVTGINARGGYGYSFAIPLYILKEFLIGVI